MSGAIENETLTLWRHMTESWTRRAVVAVRRHQEARRFRWRTAGAAAVLLALPVAAAAQPAGLERFQAETRFLERCAEEGRTPAACRRLMAGAQRRYGPAMFAVFAPQGPRGFEAMALPR